MWKMFDEKKWILIEVPPNFTSWYRIHEIFLPTCINSPVGVLAVILKV